MAAPTRTADHAARQRAGVLATGRHLLPVDEDVAHAHRELMRLSLDATEHG